MNLTTFKFFILSFLLTVLTACGGTSLIDGNVNSGTPESQAEISFCSTSTSYSPGVVVSGTAKFRRRGLNVLIDNPSNTMTAAATGAVISTALPIKYAEIRVLNSSGAIIQCGTTNALGELRALDGTSSLLLPNDAGTFTIEVLSRANYTFASAGKPVSSTLSAAVKEDIYSNSVYKVSGPYISNGFGFTNTAINLVAQANEAASSKIEGAAFNIYNDWVTAFEYLNSTSNTSNLDVSCLSTRLDMYWKAGFNPYEYVYPGTSTILSFYLREDNELYISGGQNGNVQIADTDHWDDAVILHEIGHHIENVCGRADSPGGMHFAQYRIDARLAWSEGFGNFMGAHIVKNNAAKINPNHATTLPNGEWLFYHDTVGYLESGSPTNNQLILMRLNKLGDGSGIGADHDNVDYTNFPGESHFREASIARGLFKGTNTCSANCGGGVTFDKYWTALGRTSNGMGYVTSPFSSSAKFFAKVYAANSNSFSASMTTIMTADEALHMVGSTSYTASVTSTSSGTVPANAWPGYGIKLTTTSSCDRNVLQPRSTANTYGYYSDQRYTNHFFTIRKADLGTTTEIRLVPDSSCTVDLDLVVLSSGYYYNEDCGSFNSSTGACTSFSKDLATDSSMIMRSSSSGNSESISLSGLGTGYYLLNVRGYSSNPTAISSSSSCVYKLTDQNGAQLCPSTSY